MKVLFVCSGNSFNGISPIILNQGNSLKNQKVTIEYYTIKGTGLIGYLKSITVLRKFLKKNKYDIIHAHYSFSGFVASLSGARSLIVSLMGSDVKSDKFFKVFIHIFNRFSWSKIIIKSEDMKESLGIKNVEVIPNGVDLKVFKPIEKMSCKKALNWDCKKKQILFASNPNRYEKNFSLAKKAFSFIDDINYELKVLEDISNDQIPLHFNAADVILLTSLWEGSPNVIKEAMACNRPILSTDVGDVSILLSNVDGCDIINSDVEDIARKIRHSILNYQMSNGREKLKSLKLDSKNVAFKIIKLYKEIKYGE